MSKKSSGPEDVKVGYSLQSKEKGISVALAAKEEVIIPSSTRVAITRIIGEENDE
jgi:hypothetical protein